MWVCGEGARSASENGPEGWRHTYSVAGRGGVTRKLVDGRRRHTRKNGGVVALQGKGHRDTCERPFFPRSGVFTWVRGRRYEPVSASFGERRRLSRLVRVCVGTPAMRGNAMRAKLRVFRNTDKKAAQYVRKAFLPPPRNVYLVSTASLRTCEFAGFVSKDVGLY